MKRQNKTTSDFSRNVLTLMTGTTVAQAIPLAITPILTRIYAPEDFGLFALYLSISFILASFITGRYEVAIMVPKLDSDAKNILYIAIIIASIISAILALLIYILSTSIAEFLNAPQIEPWLYLIPITVFLLGVYQSLTYWLNRLQLYRSLAGNRVFQSTSTAGTTLGFGYAGLGATGLIVGGLIGHIASVLLLFIKCRAISTKNNRKSKCSYKKLYVLAKKYKDFPRYNAPHAAMSVAAFNLPILLIGYYFNSVLTGFFSLASRVLMAPIGIVTYAYGQVFLQKLSQHRSDGLSSENFFNRTMRKLLLHSFIPFITLFIFAPQIFSYVFGDEWRVAGIYAQIISPMLYLSFTGSILSNVVVVYGKQRKALYFEVVNITSKLVSLIIGGVYGDIILGLILFSVCGVIVSTFRICWYRLIVRNYEA